MKKISIPACLTLCVMLLFTACREEIMNKNDATLILNARDIQAMPLELVPRGLGSEGQGPTFAGYAQAGPAKPLDKEEVSFIRKILMDEESYLIHDAVPACLFMPDYGLLFTHQGQELTVVFSGSCSAVKIMGPSGEKLFAEVDPVKEELLAFFEKMGLERFQENTRVETPVAEDNTNQRGAGSLSALLGTDRFFSLKEASSVRLYKMDPFPPRRNAPLPEKRIERYAILQEAEAISPEKTRELQALLLSEDTYRLDDAMKSCLFTPTVGVEFEGKDSSQYVMISFDCDVIRFTNDQGSSVMEDVDPGREQLMAFFSQYFPEINTGNNPK